MDKGCPSEKILPGPKSFAFSPLDMAQGLRCAQESLEPIMNWFYVDQGKQAGPVEDPQLAQLLAEGKIQSETLVWHEGMANWKPLREVRPGFAPASAPPPMAAPPFVATPFAVADADAICVECRNIFPRENMIHYGNSWVCAGCKPVFMQKIAEGVTNLGTSLPGTATEADLLARDYDVDIGGSVSQGWETFKTNPGMMIAALVLSYVGMMVGAVLRFIPIPLLNLVANMLIVPPLKAGLWLVYIKSVRRQPAELNDLFKAFGPRYWQTVLVALIPVLMVVAVFVVFGIIAAVTIPAFVSPRTSTTPHPHVSSAVFVPLLVMFLIVLPPWIYITTCWAFSMPLVIDKGMRFWPALELSRRIVKKHWWGTFGLLVVIGLLAISGVIACGIGMLVTLPVAIASLSVHYEKVFGDLAPQA